MSSLLVEIVKIDNIISHPDKETTNLEVAVIKGWNAIVKKNSFKANDLCIYFTIDCVLPLQLSEYIGVTKYLHSGRVKAARLRGFPSYGLLWDISACKEYATKFNLKIESYTEGTNLAEVLNITKYEPVSNNSNESPIGKKWNIILKVARFFLSHKMVSIGQKFLWFWKYVNNILPIKEDERFRKYTDIENYRNYTKTFKEDDEVILTEKIHGQNTRYGIIKTKIIVGSHNVQKKKSDTCKIWNHLTDNIENLLKDIHKQTGKTVILYGEIFGSKIQDLTYGMKDQTDFRAFDLLIGDAYIDYETFKNYCTEYDIKTVPELYKGKFSFEKIKEIETSKKSTLADNIMEGVVIKPVKESYVEFKNGSKRRKILKYVFDAYLCRKNGSEFK